MGANLSARSALTLLRKPISKSKSAFRLCDIRHGQWRSQKACRCPSHAKRVTGVNWVECDLLPRNVKNAVNFSRLGVIGTAEYWHQFRDITHDAIECHVECTHCTLSEESREGSTGVYTLDYSWFGKRQRSGQYLKQYANKRSLNAQQIASINRTFGCDLSLCDLETLFGRIWNDYTGKEYSLVNRNCKDFAEIYWDCIEWPQQARDVRPAYLAPTAHSSQ